MDCSVTVHTESVHVKADYRTISSVGEDVETLIHIIEVTGHRETLFLIVKSKDGGEILTDIMEPNGDFFTLRSIMEIIEDTEDLKLLCEGRRFSQGELDAALLFVCRHGFTFLVNEIVNLGADMQTRGRNGNTPLLICAEKGFTSTAWSLITRNVDINTANDAGDTALIVVAGSVGSVEMAKLLLTQTGLNVTHQNKDGNTALMTAVNDRNFNFIKLLLDSQEIKMEGLEGIKNRRRETAQGIADRLGIGPTVKLLLKHRTKEHSPLLEAVLTCDMASFNILMNYEVYEPLDKKYIIQNCLNTMFSKHKKSKENFTKNEEMIIQRLLENGADVNDCPYNVNPVMVATRVGSCNVLNILMKNREHFNRLCQWSQKNPLAISAKYGHAHILELLLKQNRNLAAKSFTTQALISAMKHGQLDCKEILTKHGANLDIKFAFKSAVKHDDSVRLRYLVENFKDVLKRVISAYDMTNIVVSAARNGHKDTIAVLLDAGVDVDCVNAAGKTPLMEAKTAEVVNFLVQRGAVVNETRPDLRDLDYSPLPYVLSKHYYHSDSEDRVNVVEALLKHGAPVNMDRGRESPLMMAISTGVRKEIVQLLLDHGADVSVRDSKGNNVLQIAVLNRARKDIVQLLLDYSADINVRDSKGNNVLLTAAETNSTENIECLLQQGWIRNMIDERNHEGLTALMNVVCKNNHSAVKVLISHGADLNAKDMVGNTALMVGVSALDPEMLTTLTTLIQAGTDVNLVNDNGHSALMLAARRSWTEAVTLLVDSGADINAVTDSNETALSLTMNHFGPRLSCVKYLLDHGARASYVKPEYIIRMILLKHLDFIPKFMQCGFGPGEVSPLYVFSASVTKVSPLCMALVTGNVKLASYFVENLFVTKSDMFTLIHNKDVRQHLHKHKLHECLNFLDQQSAQALPLFSLAFIAVQSAVKTTPGREERISVLPLPKVIIDRLLYKVESTPLDMSTTSAEKTVYNNIIAGMAKSDGLFSFGDDDYEGYLSFDESVSSDDEDEESDIVSDDDYLFF